MNTIIHRGLFAGRREFLKLLAAVVTMTILGMRTTSNAYAEAKDYLTSRIQAAYTHDRVMKYRKSQDNPSVKKLYAEFLSEPMSPKSEHLLHAVYVDRSAGVNT
jgi:ferredoxin hydrogenase small subunit